MTPRDWMTLALRVLGVWFAVRTFAALIGLLAAFLRICFTVVTERGADIPALFGRLVQQSFLEVIAYGAPAAVLLVFAVQITSRLYPDQTTPLPPMR